MTLVDRTKRKNDQNGKKDTVHPTSLEVCMLKSTLLWASLTGCPFFETSIARIIPGGCRFCFVSRMQL